MVDFEKFDSAFFAKSEEWLSSPKLKELIMYSGSSSDERQKWFENLEERKDYLIFGVSYNGEKIGAVGIKGIDLKRKMGEYWGYIGDESYWGRGIGNEMVEKMYEKAKEIGLRTLYLKVSKENFRAIGLYRKHGFLIVDQKENVIFMEKALL